MNNGFLKWSQTVWLHTARLKHRIQQSYCQTFKNLRHRCLSKLKRLRLFIQLGKNVYFILNSKRVNFGLCLDSNTHSLQINFLRKPDNWPQQWLEGIQIGFAVRHEFLFWCRKIILFFYYALLDQYLWKSVHSAGRRIKRFLCETKSDWKRLFHAVKGGGEGHQWFWMPNIKSYEKGNHVIAIKTST